MLLLFTCRNMSEGNRELFHLLGKYVKEGGDSIITNDNFLTFVYLTVSEGQYLKLQMSSATPAEDMAPYAGIVYGPGMYKVGYDIPAGEYNVEKEDGQLFGYVEVTKDSKGTLESIITNDNFETNKYITVQDGQYLKIQFGFIE